MVFRRHPSLALALALLAVSAIAGSCAATTQNNSFTGGAGGMGLGTTSTASTTTGSGHGGDVIGFDAGKGGGSTSSSGGVPQTCADALMRQSYIGCEYWPAVTSNSGLFKGFEFAVAAANPTDSPATVTVERAGSMV